jgi:hypothetical protein
VGANSARRIVETLIAASRLKYDTAPVAGVRATVVEHEATVRGALAAILALVVEVDAVANYA